MTAEDVAARVRSILGDVFALKPEDIGSDTSTDTVPAWDSLQHLTVVLSLEEEFDIHFDDEETVALVSFPLIVTIVGERVGITASG
jgi:acyl carrier protein